MNPLTSGSGEELDLLDVAATDAWLDQVSARSPRVDDEVASALVAWLDGIDREYVAAAEAVAANDDRAKHNVIPLRRLPRRNLAAVAIALGVTSLAGVGVAAASPGSPLYPVHRVVFGNADASTLDQASALLDQAAAIITPAQKQGKLNSGAQVRATQLLGRADGLLVSANPSHRREQLLTREQTLNAVLVAVSIPVAPVTATPSPSVVPTQATSPTPGPSTQHHSAAPSDNHGSSSGSHDGGTSGTGSEQGSGDGKGTGSVGSGGGSTGSGGSTGGGQGDGSGDRSGGSGGDQNSGDGAGGSGGSGGDQNSGDGSGGSDGG